MIRSTVIRSSSKRLEAVKDKAEAEVKRLVFQATNRVRTEAVKSIVQNPRRGGVVTRYNPKRVVSTSAAGDPPAQDTGNLSSGISSEVKGLHGKVISKAAYSKALEYGTRNMAARPFLVPAVEKAREFVRKKKKELFG